MVVDRGDSHSDVEQVLGALRERLQDPGHHPVDVPIICVLTRFGLRSARHLIPTYLEYRRIMREAAQTRTPGLLRSAFLIELPRTCFSLSIWAGEEAIPHFGTNVISHVAAGNAVFGRLAVAEDGGPEIWPTRWQLTSVSNNLNWEGLNLRELIVRMST